MCTVDLGYQIYFVQDYKENSNIRFIKDFSVPNNLDPVTKVILHYEVVIKILFPWYLCHFIFIEQDMINGYHLFKDWYSVLIILKLFIY